MKRIALTILAFVYITVSSGATVHFHYCMDKLIGWGFTSKSSDKCGSCGMVKKDHKGCCHDEHKTIKASQDHKLTEPAFSGNYNIASHIDQQHIDRYIFYLPSRFYHIPHNHAPPGEQVAKYIYFCIYKI